MPRAAASRKLKAGRILLAEPGEHCRAADDCGAAVEGVCAGGLAVHDVRRLHRLRRDGDGREQRPLSPPRRARALTAATQLVWGPLCWLTFAATLARSPARHGLAMVVCTAHLYGVALYYATAWAEHRATGRCHSRPEPLYYWVYYVGFNMPWVVVPLCELSRPLALATWAGEQEASRLTAAQLVGHPQSCSTTASRRRAVPLPPWTRSSLDPRGSERAAAGGTASMPGASASMSSRTVYVKREPRAKSTNEALFEWRPIHTRKHIR